MISSSSVKLWLEGGPNGDDTKGEEERAAKGNEPDCPMSHLQRACCCTSGVILPLVLGGRAHFLNADDYSLCQYWTDIFGSYGNMLFPASLPGRALPILLYKNHIQFIFYFTALWSSVLLLLPGFLQKRHHQELCMRQG